jgi:hypothetical protein
MDQDLYQELLEKTKRGLDYGKIKSLKMSLRNPLPKGVEAVRINYYTEYDSPYMSGSE